MESLPTVWLSDLVALLPILVLHVRLIMITKAFLILSYKQLFINYKIDCHNFVTMIKFTLLYLPHFITFTMIFFYSKIFYIITS